MVTVPVPLVHVAVASSAAVKVRRAAETVPTRAARQKVFILGEGGKAGEWVAWRVSAERWCMVGSTIQRGTWREAHGGARGNTAAAARNSRELEE